MIINILNIIKKLFNKYRQISNYYYHKLYFCLVLFLYFGLTIEEQENNTNSILNHMEIFAQEENNPPVVKHPKIIEFTGINYTDVINSR
jgi:hypothetical protein